MKKSKIKKNIEKKLERFWNTYEGDGYEEVINTMKEIGILEDREPKKKETYVPKVFLDDGLVIYFYKNNKIVQKKAYVLNFDKI